MNLLLIFLDGVALGSDNPHVNPLSRAELPFLTSLLQGERLVASAAPFHGKQASLLSLDACLGIPGYPQSATGQATILTGRNIPGLIGRHYGPKPNPPIKDNLQKANIFKSLCHNGYSCALLNAYPDSYYHAIASGRRLYSAIPMAVAGAGIPLKTTEDFIAGKALSADFTGQGWHNYLNITSVPILSPFQAGEKLAALSSQYHFSIFDFWLSDHAGHLQDMESACNLLVTLDNVLSGLCSNWDTQKNLILITSDHGNLEDLSTRRHTKNRVPALIIGDAQLRDRFTDGLDDITSIAPAVIKFIEQ